MTTAAFDRVESEAIGRVRVIRGGLLPSREEDRERTKGIIEIAIGLALLLGFRRAWMTTGRDFRIDVSKPIGEIVRDAAYQAPQLRTRLIRVPSLASSQASLVVDVGTRLSAAILSNESPAVREEAARLVAAGAKPEEGSQAAGAVRRLEGVRSRFERAAETALWSAFHEGLSEAAVVPAVVAAVPLWMDRAVGDKVTRGRPDGSYPEPHRHFQFSGYTNTMSEFKRRGLVPPLGPHCRCTLVPITMADAHDRGLYRDGRPVPGALAALNGERERLVDAGVVPDAGWRRVTA